MSVQHLPGRYPELPSDDGHHEEAQIWRGLRMLVAGICLGIIGVIMLAMALAALRG